MRILIIEDETSLQADIRERLEAEGYMVDASADGNEGLYLATEYPLDAAIIDIGLPGLSGIEIIQHLRDQGDNLPVLILTARSRWQEKVEGLEAGADDVITEDDGSIEVQTLPDSFIEVKKTLEDAGLTAGYAEITQRASTETELDTENAEKLMRLIDALEDLDDVQEVHFNASFPDDFEG